MRAGIYARYSSDRQDERSIDDQLRICREFAERRGYVVADVFADYELSAASLKTRPQALRLVAAARARAIDVIIAEDLDRLSRDQEDIAFIYKRATFAGVPIMTLSDGRAVGPLEIGLKGTMNAIDLIKLGDKVRRGQRGRIEAGRSAGGLGYGYKVVKELGEDGELKRGLREIDQDEAAIVLRIFAEIIAGRAARAIAAQLNREGVPAPFGKYWNASTINGSPQRGTGILCNAAYVGKLVYNRVRMLKDPDTGKRVSRLNPPAEWIIRDAPELRIVNQNVWDAVQAMKHAIKGTPMHRHRRPQHLLSGLARCGVCGGSYVLRDRDRLGCSRHHESGDEACPNRARIPRALLEHRVLDGLKAKLLTPAAIHHAAEIYLAERNRLAAAAGDRRLQIEQRTAKLGREIERGVKAIFAGNASRTLQAGLAALEAEKEQLELELTQMRAAATDVVKLHPGAIEAYTHAIEGLHQALGAEPQDQAPAIAKLRQLIDRVEILPDYNAPEGLQITAYGRLAKLLEAGAASSLSPTWGRAVVAGEGVEPPTLGL